MNWSKVQTALIVLFLLINIFLLCNIASSRFVEISSEKKDLEKTVHLLSVNKISVPEILPKSPKMQVLTVENAVSDADKIAEALFKSTDFIKEEKESLTIYKYNNQNLIISGGFIEYKRGEESSEPSEKKAEKLLSELGFDIKHSFVTKNSSQIIFTGSYDKKTIYSNKITVELFGDEINYLRGRWANITGKSGSRAKITPVSDALIKLLQDGIANVSVTDVCAGYEIIIDTKTPRYKTAEAVPVWKVSLQNGLIRFYDARK